MVPLVLGDNLERKFRWQCHLGMKDGQVWALPRASHTKPPYLLHSSLLTDLASTTLSQPSVAIPTMAGPPLPSTGHPYTKPYFDPYFGAYLDAVITMILASGMLAARLTHALLQR